MVVWGAGEGEGVGAAPCASAARPRLALPPAVDAPLNPTPRHPPQAALDWAGATDTAHADTRLLVAVVWASGDASHPTIDRARSWAACSGFELVRAAPADAGADAALAADDEGVPRIAAALEARHWPGMVMKAKVGRAVVAVQVVVFSLLLHGRRLARHRARLVGQAGEGEGDGGAQVGARSERAGERLAVEAAGKRERGVSARSAPPHKHRQGQNRPRW